MMAYNLIQNAVDEAKGAARVHLVAERYASPELKKKMLRHVSDEMRHSRLFAQLIQYTGYDYEENDSEEENERSVTELFEFDDDLSAFLLEPLEEILTLHRLKAPQLLRDTLHSTNPIESVFSQVRRMEKNIQRYRSSKMSRRWLGACLLDAEKHFRKVKSYRSIPEVIKNIELEQQNRKMKKAA